MPLSMIEFEKTKKIVELYQRSLYYFLLKILHNKEDAEDAFQDTLVAIINNISRIDDPTSSTCKSYIFIIAKNKALDIFKKKGSAVTETYSEIVINMMEDVEYSNIMASLLEKETLDEYLRGLSREDADLLVLKYEMDMDYAEIAKEYNISGDAARQRVSRAQRRLATILRGE